MVNRLSLISVLVTALLFAQSVRSDDAVINTGFPGVGPDLAQEFQHEDAAPFKGWVMLTVQNSGTESWTDFHFEIYEIPGFPGIENIHFLVDAPYQPVSSQSPLTWFGDNVSVGAKLDLYFPFDPVLPGQTATFQVYTDNPDQLTWFGLIVYPTPEPGSLLVFGGGAVLMLWRKTKAKIVF